MMMLIIFQMVTLKSRPESIPFEIASFAVLPLIYQNEIVGTLFINKIEIESNLLRREKYP